MARRARARAPTLSPAFPPPRGRPTKMAASSNPSGFGPSGPSLTGFTTPKVAPNNMDVYVNSYGFGLVGHYERDFAPVCANRSQNVPGGVAAAVGLDCSDANGDPVSLAKVAGPTKGTLADIDQA